MYVIGIAAPVIEDEEIKAVNEVLKSGHLVQGPRVEELEEKFAAFCGTTYAVAVNSGTAAIHAALFAAGVGPGDEVITTPFTFIATVNCIIMTGAKPVLVDIDPKTFNIDPAKIEAKITKATKAIIPIHLFGQPCDMDAVSTIAKKHKLKIVEDACQAVGADYKGKTAGNLGDLGCFSLYATKNVISGEGGIVTTDNEDYAVAMKRFRQHGMSGAYQYEYLGYNYRMTDLLAAIGVEQLKKAERFTARRQENARQLDVGLKNIKGLSVPPIADGRSHVYHQYTIRLDKDFPVDRQKAIELLKANGVGAGVYYPLSLHMVPHIAKYGYKKGDFPESERAAEEVLSLPVHPKVTDEDIAHIVKSVRELKNG